MFKLTERCEGLRSEAMDAKSISSKISAQRAVRFVLGCLKAPENSDNMILTACGISETAVSSPAIIAEGELIVGYNYADDDRGYGYLYSPVPDDLAGRAVLRENGFAPGEIESYFSNREKAGARFKYSPVTGLHEKYSDLSRERSARAAGIDSNHSVIGYEKVLKLGFEGLLKQVQGRGGSNSLYRAMEMLCGAGCKLGQNYAAKARQLLSGSICPRRAKELEEIAERCSQVPAKPARNFSEALQSVWFAHIINTWEDGINANSLGRLDQILYPYYKKDIETGLLTKEEAFELICCLWIKLYRDYDVQQSCVGGCTPEGEPAENELSFLMLDATEQLGFIRCLSVRYSKKTDRAFLRKALGTVGHLQKGIPFFFNDDVLIPALVSKGISQKDARDYTQIGCVETVIPGKSNPHAVTGQTNLLKAIEYVMRDGKSMFHRELAPGLETGGLDSFSDFDGFWQAVLKQIGHILDMTCHGVARHTEASVKNAPRPYKSLLTENCIENGLDFNEYGAKYDYYQVMLGGIPNLADSLAAVKKFVFDERKLTLFELYEHLDKDFPDEALRLELINKAPKFGNDIREVDEIAFEITDFACDCLERLSEKYGLSFHAQPFTFLWMIDDGRQTAATPDGRRAGEILAYSVSPMQGRDSGGLTALLNSIASLPTKKTPGTTSAIVEIDPNLFTDANIDHLVDILLAASQKGLCNIQFNVIDADMLRDAQKHPEKYNNLAVRVSGFSQKFNLLSGEMQEHIIGRTKHRCF